MATGWKWIGSVAVTAVLAGPAAGDEAAGLSLALGGLDYVGPVGEGRMPIAIDEASEEDALEAATAVWGEPIDRDTMEECGAGPIDYARFGNGVTLHFQDGTFAGWMADSADAPFFGGAGVGSTLAELESVAGPVEVFQSTIGHEFSAGPLFGITGGTGTDGTVELLWNGVSCIFR